MNTLSFPIITNSRSFLEKVSEEHVALSPHAQVDLLSISLSFISLSLLSSFSSSGTATTITAAATSTSGLISTCFRRLIITCFC